MAKEKRDIEIKSRADTLPLMGPDVRPWPVTPPPSPEECMKVYEKRKAGEFGKFLLLIGRKLINQSASALGGESWVPKECRAICMLENGPNASMKSEELQPAPVKVPTVDRIWVSQEFRREELLCR